MKNSEKLNRMKNSEHGKSHIHIVTNEAVNEQANEPVSEQANEPVNEQANEPVNEQANEPVSEQANEPVNEQANEPVSEQANEPVSEQVMQMNELKSIIQSLSNEIELLKTKKVLSLLEIKEILKQKNRIINDLEQFDLVKADLENIDLKENIFDSKEYKFQIVSISNNKTITSISNSLVIKDLRDCLINKINTKIQDLENELKTLNV